MHTVEKFEKEISVSDYLRGYVAVEEFLQKCKECPNYNKIWSCPPYDFNPEDYWKKYKTLKIFARKINFQEEMSEEEGIAALWQEKAKLSRELFELEEKYAGSVSLSAGSCQICSTDSAGGTGSAVSSGGADERCTRTLGEPCRYPEKMRYSIESIGGNVGLTVSKLLGIELEWVTDGKLPSYFVLVSGLLMK